MSYIDANGSLHFSVTKTDAGSFKFRATKTTSGSLLYPVTNNLFDLFIGDGFKTGMRIKKHKEGYSVVKTWGKLPNNYKETFQF